MRRSLVKLVVVGVLACWAAGFAGVFLYARTRSWTGEMARRDGVFLAYEILNRAPLERRTERLRELRQHFSVDLSLLTMDEVEHRLGRSVNPGDQIPQRVSAREEWYFLVFDDGRGTLAAGPVNPAIPRGFIPIGVLLAIVGLPVFAGLLALRVDRRLTRVERASKALAEGDLSVRVNDRHASQDELATSFNAMAERVEVLIRSRDELVQAVSHELGSPLSRLRFHVELLEGRSEEKRAERLSAMVRELDSLDGLVAELLSYVQSEDLEIDRREFAPNQSISDLAELARLEGQGDRTVGVDLKLSAGSSVFADQRLFQRAVENVLRNAVQHARGEVLLEVAQEADHVAVVVHDDGPGIPEDLREKVKTPFFRLQADRGRKTGGMGLGLAIVGRIMNRHGGHLDIGNSQLGGAKVTMFWPLARQGHL